LEKELAKLAKAHQDRKDKKKKVKLMAEEAMHIMMAKEDQRRE
jgi:hypothetical protein